MYGPKYSPGSEPNVLQTPDEALWFTIALGTALTACALFRQLNPKTRAWLFCFGQVVLLTAPLALVLSSGFYGDYPTTDKAGSLYYYLDGVHERFLFEPVKSLNDCAVQLIGVHMGHLWVTAFFDLFLPPNGAFNIQALVYPALAWWSAALLLHRIGGRWDNAIVLGFAYGLCLHVFRDLNWYTIEKAAIFALPLYAYALLRAHEDGGKWVWLSGLFFFGAAFLNWYLALVAGAGACLAIASSRSMALLKSLGYGLLFLSPLIVVQLLLMRNGDPGVPIEHDYANLQTLYLEERAALDSVSLTSMTWNRLELLHALNPCALILILAGLFRGPLRGIEKNLLLIAAGLFAFSLGPYLFDGIKNPVYIAAWKIVPGFWRVAKPEVFFYGTWICMLALAASRWRDVSLKWAYPIMLLLWVWLVRGHPAYPGFSVFEYSAPKLCNTTQTTNSR